MTVRRGLEETWKTASREMMLKDIDTIRVGENAEVVLELSDNATFTLGSNSILDIGDLRRITKREMFLYIMALKIEKIDRPKKDDKIQAETNEINTRLVINLNSTQSMDYDSKVNTLVLLADVSEDVAKLVITEPKNNNQDELL